MHSLKTTCTGQIFALAKPHDSVGKRTRNRIPKQERKTLVESFIKKHQNLNNGSFPSLSLTHKEVGGSFYTIREIVREIIQENRVLGASDLIFEGKGSENLQDKILSNSIVMDPVPPLSLSPNGFHSASDQNYNLSSEAGEDKSPGNERNINSIQVSQEERGSDLLNSGEVNTTQLFKEDVGLLVHQPMGTTDISSSSTQFETSCSEENDTKHDAGLHDSAQTICDNFATKPHGKDLTVDNKEKGFEGIPFIESKGTKPVNIEERVNYAGAAMTEMVNMTKNTLGTIDLPADTIDVQPNELDEVCESGKGIDAKVETDSNTITSVDLGEISSSTSAVPEEQGNVNVNVGQMPNYISATLEKKVEEKIVNPASINLACADTEERVGVKAVIGNIHETKEFSNGTLTTEESIPISGIETGSCKNDIAKADTMSNHARNEVTNVEEATKEKEKLATLNRIKPESWKGETNRAGHETNPLLAVLKSFLTAFVKFWSE